MGLWGHDCPVHLLLFISRAYCHPSHLLIYSGFLRQGWFQHCKPGLMLQFEGRDLFTYRFGFILPVQFHDWLFIWFCNDTGTGLELHRRVETRNLAQFEGTIYDSLQSRLLPAFQEFEQCHFHDMLSSSMVVAASEMMLQAYRVLLWKTQPSKMNFFWMRWMPSSSPRIGTLAMFPRKKPNPFYSPVIKSEDIINITTLYLAIWLQLQIKSSCSPCFISLNSGALPWAKLSYNL